MNNENKVFLSGVLGILIAVSILLIDDTYIKPKIKESTVNSSIECERDISKCWIHNKE
jgi:hypothetical protein